MNRKFLIVDAYNLMMRARHVGKTPSGDRAGLCLAIMFTCLRQAWRKFGAHHVVFCLESRSWRKDFYEPYKKNRADARAARTSSEIEEDKMFDLAWQDFVTFITEKTNCTVLKAERCEADDLIARWTQKHPDDQHIIVSTDSDFQQLISSNVILFNGVSDRIYYHDRIEKLTGKPHFNKDGTVEEPENPQWVLFEKCIRGDSSDHVMSAYPGARAKSSKKAIGMIDAFEDRFDQGWSWQNFMRQSWVDIDGVEHKVLEDYTRNVKLIDLTAQPEDIIMILDACIDQAYQSSKFNRMVQLDFGRFCSKWDLTRISEQSSDYVAMLFARLVT